MFSSNGSQVSGPGESIEDLFSTYLYTGTGATQTITNGIDLSTKGGLVWIKDRDNGFAHNLKDTVRGAGFHIRTSTIEEQTANPYDLTAFTSSGFTLGVNGYGGNYSGAKITSWTFRKQPKFFDIVTYTGNGTAGRTVAHSLGSVPGFIIVKAISGSGAGSEGWRVYHRSQGATKYAMLQSTNAFGSAGTVWNNTEPTSTNFTVGSDTGANGSGLTFIAYLFAHDAGGFGTTGTDNAISCGSISPPNYTQVLGWEPQFVLMKRADGVGDWFMFDSMRGLTADGGTTDKVLYANTSGAETTSVQGIELNSTGFRYGFSNEMIYIAIRRGPMKVPTVGTSVFSPQVQTPTGAIGYVAAASSGFPIDWVVSKQKGIVTDWYQTNRVTNNYMSPNTTGAEASYTYGFDLMQGVSAQWSANITVTYSFKRAPSFFDEVCYTGTSTARTQAHNLGVAPELMIFRRRGITDDWWVTSNFGASTCKYMYLNQTGGQANLTYSSVNQYTAAPTATGLLFGSDSITNGPYSYVCYLFATCAGVSKVGSYTGTGTTLQIDCGFTTGARFVLIKRTDTTGDWYVWDSARGIVAGNDPYLLLNSTAAEVTNTDYVDTYNAGFELSSTAPAALNANGGTFIFLAIA